MQLSGAIFKEAITFTACRAGARQQAPDARGVGRLQLKRGVLQPRTMVAPRAPVRPRPMSQLAVYMRAAAILLWGTLFASDFPRSVIPCALCRCVPSGSPAKELAHATAVFSGRVDAITRDDSIPPLDTAWSVAQQNAWFVRLFEQRQVRISVLRVWKGQVSETITLVTGGGGPDCSYEFEIGAAYLVYAYPSRRAGLSATSCSRTRLLSKAEEDMRELGPGWPLAIGTSDSRKRPHN